MKNKIILIIVLAGAALAYQFQDQLFNNEISSTPVAETSKAPPPKVRDTKPLKIENIVINKTFAQFYDVPPMLDKMMDGLNKLFEFEKLTFKAQYSYYNTFEEVPAEKWESDIVITRTLAAIELVKQEKNIDLLFFVSPLLTACFQEVQLVTLLDSKVGSMGDLNNKDIFVEGLKGVNNLALRRFVTDEDFAPKSTAMDLSINDAIEKMYQQTVQASVVHSGNFSPLNPVSKNFRILKTSDYKIPCYTLFLNKRIPQDTRDLIKGKIIAAINDKAQVQMLRAAIGIDYAEEISPDDIKDLLAMVKKYEKAEMKVYIPPVVKEKTPEAAAAIEAPLFPVPDPNPNNTVKKDPTPEQIEAEKLKAEMLKMKEQQEKQKQEIKLLQDKLLEQQKAAEKAAKKPVNEFKTPQEIMQEQKI